MRTTADSIQSLINELSGAKAAAKERPRLDWKDN